MSWLPHGILATLFVAAAGLLWRILGHAAEAMLRSIDDIKSQLDGISRELGKFATLDQLGRMGDRFDSRHVEIHKDIGSIRERLAAIEAKNGSED